MIEYLKAVADLLAEGLNLSSEVTQKQRRKKFLLDLLISYFCIARIVENGSDLLSLAGREPIKRIMAMTPEKRVDFTNRANSKLQTQKLLLQTLDSRIADEGIMEMLDAKPKKRLKRLIGSREKGLLAVASALEIYFIFDGHPSRREIKAFGQELARFRYQASIISMVFFERSQMIIDVRLAKKELRELEASNEKLRSKIDELFTLDEQLRLVERAKKVASSV